MKVEYQDSGKEVNDFKTVLVQKSTLEAKIIIKKKEKRPDF